MGLTFILATEVEAVPPPAGEALVVAPSGGFAIDGDLLSGTPKPEFGDWLAGPNGAGVLDAAGNPINPATTFHFRDPYSSSSDQTFGGGLKWTDNPSTWTWTLSGASAKTDINNALMHITTDAAGNTWLVVAADRASNNGDSYIDFEFLQSTLYLTNISGVNTFYSAGPHGGRTVNDVLLSLAFTGGGNIPDFFAWRWMPDGTGYKYVDSTTNLPDGQVFVAASADNTSVPIGAFGTNVYGANAFAEAAINLTALLGGFDPCLSIGVRSIMVKTKTSQASSASINDFIDPIQYTLRIGPSADAGLDQTRCDGGEATIFDLNGVATRGMHPISSVRWEVVSGAATIDTPGELVAKATVTVSPATLRLTVTQGNCTETDDVVLAVAPVPAATITWAEATTVCPQSTTTFSGPAGATSYSWSVSGNGSIAGDKNSQKVEVTAGPNCGESFTLSLTVANETCSGTESLVVPVNDTESPIITGIPADVAVNCAASVPAANYNAVVASDNCAGALTISHSDETLSGSCANRFVVKRTYTVADVCGNASSQIQTITVNDTTPPVLTLPSDRILQCPGDTRTQVTGVATAVDGCGTATVAYSDTVIPGCGGTKTVLRLWKATDQCGNTAESTQTITVIDTQKPTISCPSVTVQCVGDVPAPYATLAAFRAAGGQANDTCSSALTFALVSDSGVVGSCPGTVTRVYRVTDECGNSAEGTQTIVVDDTIAPVITCPPAVTVNTDASLDPANTGAATAKDNCSVNVALAHADTVVPSQFLVKFYASDPVTNSAPYLPTYIKLGPGDLPRPESALVTGRAADPLRHAVAFDPEDRLDALTSMGGEPLVLGQVVPFQTVIEVSGSRGPENGTIEFTAAWSTYSTSNERFGYDTNYMVYCAFVDLLDPGSIDPHRNARVQTYSSQVVNRGMINEQIQGTFRVSGLDSGDRVVVEIWVVLDSTRPEKVGGTINSELVSASKATSPPQPISIGNQTISLGSLSKIGPLPPPGSAPSQPPLPPQPPEGRIPAAIVSIINRTWTASDDCANQASCVQRITVVDETAPTLTVPADMVLEYPADTTPGATGTATAADNSGSVMITYTDYVETACGPTALIVREWKATDSFGHSITGFQFITVLDTTPPELVLPPNKELNYPAGYSTADVGVATATDASGPVVPSCTDEVVRNSGGTKVIARTWTAMDACGNKAVACQYITILGTGTEVPVVVSGPKNQSPGLGKDLVLSVDADGSGLLTYQWYFNGELIADATNSSYTLPSLQFTNAGVYSVVITSPEGFSTESSAVVNVVPKLTTRLERDLMVLVWEGDFLAQTTTDINGIWVTVPGSNYPIDNNELHRFFRLRPKEFSISVTYPGGVPVVEVSGSPGLCFALQASSNFVDWVDLAVGTAPMSYTDNTAEVGGVRIYRVVPLPESITVGK